MGKKSSVSFFLFPSNRVLYELLNGFVLSLSDSLKPWEEANLRVMGVTTALGDGF